jgi:hypothetical protein
VVEDAEKIAELVRTVPGWKLEQADWPSVDGVLRALSAALANGDEVAVDRAMRSLTVLSHGRRLGTPIAGPIDRDARQHRTELVNEIRGRLGFPPVTLDKK